MDHHGSMQPPSDKIAECGDANEPRGMPAAGTGGVSTRSGSVPGEGRRERHSVRFTLGGDAFDDDEGSPHAPQASGVPRDGDPTRWENIRPHLTRISPAHSRDNSLDRSVGSLKRPKVATVDRATSPESAERGETGLPIKPRPSATRNQSYNSDFDDITEEEPSSGDEKAHSQLTAHDRAQRLARLLGSQSAPASAHTSPTSPPAASPLPSRTPSDPSIHGDDIPLLDLSTAPTAADVDSGSDEERPPGRSRVTNTSEAHKLVRMHTKRSSPQPHLSRGGSSALRSGQVTPIEERDPDDYVPQPPEYRGGILFSLLKLYDAAGQSIGGMHGNHGDAIPRSRQGSADSLPRSRQGSHDDAYASSLNTTETAGSSGWSTPHRKQPKWHSKGRNSSTTSLAGLVDSSSVLAAPGLHSGGRLPGHAKRPMMRPRQSSTSKIGAAFNKLSPPRLEDEIRITVHIAETMARQKYLLKICKALMSFGAPTHRLEEYMKMSARVLEIDGQFLYIPGCMIISFDDASTHTTEVKLVRVSQGVDLGKLRDTHQIYKEVVHDVIGVEEATQRLDQVIKRRQKFHPWLLVVVYGFASASVGPFAFQARLIDLPVAFLLGALLGVLQLIVAPKSDLFSNVFEIFGAVLTSFLARAFGSIYGGKLFCFSALAQSAIALILPGYTVLCGALELQSKSMVAGSVRMVYAIIYSLFLGFGITIGTAIYGLMDPHAVSATHCSNTMPRYYSFFFVPIFTLCLIIINQAKWRQAPVMILISLAGYTVNFFSAQRFPSNNAQISNALGAFAVGVLGNLYSRLRHGVAAAALLPAIFVQVPSGLAASGSLVAGVTSADQILNGTQPNSGIGNASANNGNTGPGQLNSVVFAVGYSMIQVAIGITVGLFLSALVVYPFGKRRSGLFSF
ncbi:MAG: Prohibitin-1, subunit of the prohibitin complex (Phb1p-Phb2p) [Chaenotheca gracillima]|nr:MAG: Prohibitin-1, subunit of the prohibitin complex (Phb1p-Phb2p) [Chaenotheca gracillima]